MANRTAVFMLAGSAILAVGHSQAQTARPSSGASAQAVQQLQQLQQLAAERTALQADNARLKQELDAVRKEFDALKSGQQATERKAQSAQSQIARSAAERDETARELELQKARMQELVGKSREIVELLRTVERDKATFQQAASERERALNVCVDRNVALYRMNGELLDRIDGSGFWSAAARSEPFTQIKRAQLENLIEDYRYRAEEQKVPVPATSSTEPAAN